MLTLGISTSSGQFALILGRNGKITYNSKTSAIENELDEMLLDALAFCNEKAANVTKIIVDIGPGGTSRVRTGVAFANSLSYALNIPVYPVSSMELAGVDVWSRYQLPVISTVRSIKGNAYIGLYDKKLIAIEYGPVEEVVPKLTHYLDEFVVVGFHREAIINLPSLQNKIITDSELLFGDASLFIEKEEIFTTKEGLLFPHFAQPITEITL